MHIPMKSGGKMKIEKICQYCGKSYFIPPNQFDRSKFCSDQCFRKNKNTRVDCFCDCCGKPIQVQKGKYEKALKGNRHLYCGRTCANNAQKPKWDDIIALFDDRGYVLLASEYISAKSKLEYVCPYHNKYGSQYITYNNLKQGFGCKYCGIERVASSRRLSLQQAKEIFARHDMVLLDQEYKNSNTPMKYICKHHEEFGVQYMALSNAYKQHCPHCNTIKGEDKISRYFLENNIKFVPHKSYDDLRGVGGGKLSYDFYLPNFNLLIEYQGEQHEHPVNVFGGEEQFQIQQEHDFRKREYAKTHGVELFEIWYYDFANLEQILDNKFLKAA